MHLDGHARAWPLGRFAVGAVVQERLAGRDIVLLGDGAREDIRAYAGDGRRFIRDPDGAIRDESALWQLTEEALIGPAGRSLPRLPGHTAYWFAWAAQFPGTASIASAHP